MSAGNLWLATLSLATTLPISAAESGATPTPESIPAAPDAPALTPGPDESCKLSGFHEFDFWIGDWEVFATDGGKLGENRISVVNKGCTLAEHWTNSSGGEGRSYNAFDGLTKRWYQFWTDDQGGTLSLSGGLQNGSMVLTGERPNLSDGKPQRQRITWTPNVDGSVRQLWETSDDGGASWQTSFDGAYRRRP
ncbi:MAG: hypothetical protein SGI99_01955 [Pseudomonadota bacterium]|nr:hypothetical protein [Pseudomonadota bacterium]